MRLLVLRCIVVASLTGVVVWAQGDQPSLAEVLKAAGEYVATFERTASLVAQEDYYQLVENNRRTLRSDMLFIPDEAFGWVEFRDVAASDGLPVRDREERLLTLFTKPNPDRLKQAQRIAAEGARFNLNPRGTRLNRTINLPLTAIRFLRPASQHRSTFRITRWNRESSIVSLQFTEQYRPRLINTSDQAAANGRFEIERATGRVMVLHIAAPERQHPGDDHGQVRGRSEARHVAAADDGGTVSRAGLRHGSGEVLGVPTVPRGNVRSRKALTSAFVFARAAGVRSSRTRHAGDGYRSVG